MLRGALEEEVAAYVERHAEARDGEGRRLVVRNGQARARGITCGAYRIASNKAEAARIAGLSPARQAFEIGKIADSIKSKASTSEPMEAMKPLSGGGGPAPSIYDTTNPSSDRLSDEEWIRREEERVKKRMGGR